MSGPFDSDVMEAVDESDFTDELDTPAQFDEGDTGDPFGDEMFEEHDEFAPGASLSGDGFDAMEDGAVDGIDEVSDIDVWNAFEEELADGLDAADDDEFLGRLLGGLGRAAGVVGRGLTGAAGTAGQVGAFARRAGRIAGQAGRVASAVTPAALAAARLARMLGAPGVAGALGQAGRFAQGVGRMSGQVQGLAGSLGQTASGAQSLLGQLGQLLGQASGADEAFDAVADLYLEDGVDEALPAVVGLAARAAARGLGFRNTAQLSQAARRALVRGVASAARELVRARGPQAVRALPRLAQSAGRVARRQGSTPQRAAQLVRRGLPETARRVAHNPRMVNQLTQPAGPRPLARATDLGRGARRGRTLHISGPATLRIIPR